MPVLVLLAALPAGPLPAQEAALPDSTTTQTAAPSARALESIVAGYQLAGEQSNLAMKNQDLELERSRAALDAARARFYPELAFSARYTRADGGRQIDLPLGQLLNPAYQTLNDLLVANGGTPKFPLLSDQSIPLQLPREQDTRLTLRQALYAPAITAGADAARAGVASAGYQREAFRRALRRDVALAYLDWLKARGAARILGDAAAALDENLRVNQSLYGSGKGTHDAVLRARAEQLAVQQQQGEAEDAIGQARSYLNFLLNRALETPLEAPVGEWPDPDAGESKQSAAMAAAPAATAEPAELPTATAPRPDLLALDSAAQAAAAQLRAAHAARRPTLALGVDAGVEGTRYGTGPRYNFVTGSLALTWTLFDGGARRAAVAQARIAERQLDNQREMLAKRIGLERQQSRDRLRTAAAGEATAQARAAAARAAFRIASRRRDAGMASTLEFLDARSELTGAELNFNLSHYTLLQRRAEDLYARGEEP
jgi:outer membrane protein